MPGAIDRPVANAVSSARLVVAFLLFVVAHNEATAYAVEFGDPWFLRYFLWGLVVTGVALGVARMLRRDLPGSIGPPMAVIGAFATVAGLGPTITCQYSYQPDCFTGYAPDPLLLVPGIAALFVGLFVDLGTCGTETGPGA